MSDFLLSAIAQSSERGWLERCRDFNAKLGKTSLADAAAIRLRELDFQKELSVRPEANGLEARVTEAGRVYRAYLKCKHGRNQAAGYTEREIRQHGPREALIRTIRRRKKTEGLKALALNNRLDCSYEQIALDFSHELPEDVVVQARQTLAELASSVEPKLGCFRVDHF